MEELRLGGNEKKLAKSCYQSDQFAFPKELLLRVNHLIIIIVVIILPSEEFSKISLLRQTFSTQFTVNITLFYNFK